MSRVDIDPKISCGICGFLFQKDDSLFLLDESRYTPYPTVGTKEYLYRPLEYRLTNDPPLPDNVYPDPADRPPKGSQVTPVHRDCLKVCRDHAERRRRRPSQPVSLPGSRPGSLPGLSKAEAMRRLTLAATWRSPWLEAPCMYLFESPTLQPVYAPEALKRLGLERLAAMPPEILLAIQKVDVGSWSLLWRLNAAVGLAQRLRAAEPDERPPVALADVLSWERGVGLVLVGEDAATTTTTARLPLARLTMDARGLRQIERLPAYPDPAEGERTDQLVYALCDEQQMAYTTVLFRYGMARLEVPSKEYGHPFPDIHLWDTPTPPSPRTCVFYNPVNLARSLRFLTINIGPKSPATGLTFFMGHSGLQSVHIHTSKEPCAQTTLDRVPARCDNIFWHYLPLAKGDRIETFGVRKENDDDFEAYVENTCLAFLVHMKKAGDVIVGHLFQEFNKDILLNDPEAPPKMLIFAMDPQMPITTIGVYTGEKTRRFRPRVQVVQLDKDEYYDDYSVPGYYGYMSRAPVAHVTRLEVFYEKRGESTVGALLGYEDGSQRCIGSCRLGVEDSLVYEKPTRICYSSLDQIENDLTLNGSGTSDGSVFRIPPPPDYSPREIKCWMGSFPSAGPLIRGYSNDKKHKHSLSDDDEPQWVCLPSNGVLLVNTGTRFVLLNHTLE